MVPAFKPTIVAWGATPATPMPLSAPAMIVDTCVPWPWRSWTAALFEQSPLATSAGAAVGVSEKMNEQDRARSRLGTTSACVVSTPLSITPTLTPAPVGWADDAGPAWTERLPASQ